MPVLPNKGHVVFSDVYCTRSHVHNLIATKDSISQIKEIISSKISGRLCKKTFSCVESQESQEKQNHAILYEP